MAATLFSRSLLTKPIITTTKTLTLTSTLSRNFPTTPTTASATVSVSPRTSCLTLLHRIRPLSAASFGNQSFAAVRAAAFSTRPTSSSLSDPNPNWSNRPPKETILLDGCDFEHWLVVVEKPEGDPTRDEIIDSYIKILAQVVGSEEEARMKIYSVSTRCYFAFGALVSEELSYKIKELPGVRWVLPDSYLDVKNKDYGGEPFINGQAVPYDPKYHEEWIRNNSRANERNKRNENRPRKFDRSRNFEGRTPRDSRNVGAMSPLNNMGGMPPQNNMGDMPPQNNMGGMPPQNMGGRPPQNMGGWMPPQNNMGGWMPPPNNMGGIPSQNMGGTSPQNNMGGVRPQNSTGGLPPQHNTGGMPLQNTGGMPPQNNMGGMPPQNMGGVRPRNNMGGVPPPNNMGGVQPDSRWSGNVQNYQGAAPNTQFQNCTPSIDVSS
ncbi:hypothetical protein CFOL_v3_07575 [Cephalotus follicularis]|uniref:MORF/ORRM1/DAG-like MORF domain-containing protein n=1 Tax=Cephalotus follicularis TaxID=3775 RepID=A0A1Q3B7P9_CEPFO|nr:hypothetical protein CFOL_v3_07575 [Cephalotus follicularis]